jgi:hypothetical protein
LELKEFISFWIIKNKNICIKYIGPRKIAKILHSAGKKPYSRPPPQTRDVQNTANTNIFDSKVKKIL